ncbi:MAG: SRPBCC family protein, partial [Bacteroidota bacterium]
MPKMHIHRTIDINAPKEDIKAVLTDFNQWQEWSPWLIAEPAAKVEIADDAQSYRWTGARTGEGEMAITSTTDDLIKYDLRFIKPWKSESKVTFGLHAQEDHTKVSWTMDSSLPFFLFWMKKSMEAFVGSDYDRGLNMLKKKIETGSVPSKLEFV